MAQHASEAARPNKAAAGANKAHPLLKMLGMHDDWRIPERVELHRINPAAMFGQVHRPVDNVFRLGNNSTHHQPRTGNFAIQDAGDEHHRFHVGHENRYNAGDKKHYLDVVGDEHAASSTHDARGRGRPLWVVGIMAASAAVTGPIAAGTAAACASPAAALSSFALLLGGLSLIVVHVRRAARID